MRASIARVGVGGFALYPSLLPFFYFALLTRLSFFSLSLALMRADPAVLGLNMCLIDLITIKDAIDH